MNTRHITAPTVLAVVCLLLPPSVANLETDLSEIPGGEFWGLDELALRAAYFDLGKWAA